MIWLGDGKTLSFDKDIYYKKGNLGKRKNSYKSKNPQAEIWKINRNIR
jgi:hypothetical protein